MSRIKENYIFGSGDKGLSNILKGNYLYKDHPACEIQGSIEELRNAIESCLYEEEFKQENVKCFLEYLDRNIFFLASFCYQKGEPYGKEKELLPREILFFLDNESKKLRKECGDCKDFLKQHYKSLIAFDKIRIKTRELERRYTAWKRSEPVKENSYNKTQVEDWILFYSSFLNRLSNWLFEVIRYEALLLEKENPNIKSQTNWVNKVEKFDITLFENKNLKD